ncbi:MAG: MFS transporter, partial [Chloroflexi bacterium]|nr:MFS transporter [Chloroflexota bacterium]
QALGETISLARGSHTVAALLLVKTTFGVGVGAVLLLAVFGSTVFRAGDLGIGLLFAARGLGALVGPFVARSAATADDRRLMRGIAIALLVFIGCYLLFPLAPSIWIAAVLVFGAHLGGGAQWTLSSYGLQRSVPDRIRGRVFSFDYAMLTLTVAVSTLIAGQLVDPVGPTVALYALMGAATLASAAWLIWTRSLWRPARSSHSDEKEAPGIAGGPR